jgi:AraC family transcriptional regulator
MLFREKIVLLNQQTCGDFFPEKFSNEIYYSNLKSDESIAYYSDYTIKYVKTGKEIFLIDGREFIVKAGHMLVVPQGSYVKTVFCDAEGYSIFIDQELVQDIVKNRNANAVQLDQNKKNSIEFSPYLTTRFGGLKNNIESILLNGTSYNSVVTPEIYYSLGEALVMGNIKVYDEVDRIDRVKIETRQEIYKRLEVAYDIIMEDYAGNISLDKLAQTAHMSKYNLIRFFKQVYGITPKQLQIERRLQYAHQLLSSTNAPSVGELSLMLGYTDVPSFSNQFKSAYGIRPSNINNC